MIFRPEITDPVEKVCDLADNAFAVLFIGRDHGVTPQAHGCIDKVINVAMGLSHPVVDQIIVTFEMVKNYDDKVWDSQDRCNRLCECCIAVRDIVYKEWKHDEWMQARSSWEKDIK